MIITHEITAIAVLEAPKFRFAACKREGSVKAGMCAIKKPQHSNVRGVEWVGTDK